MFGPSRWRGTEPGRWCEMKRLWMCVLVGLVAAAACGDIEPESTIVPTTAEEAQVIAISEENVVYATWEEGSPTRAKYAWEGESMTLSMYAPAEPKGAPIVVFLPGGGGSATAEESGEFFERLVGEGVIVFGARHAFVDSMTPSLLLPDPTDHGATMRAAADSAACAIRFARERAAELGSTDPVVALVGFSGGGGVASIAALNGASLEARWDEYASTGGPPSEIECEVTAGSTHVDGLVGMTGLYDIFVPIFDGKHGSVYQQARDPELQQFLSGAIGANPDLKVRLFHGAAEEWIPSDNSAGFAAALADAGYDVEFVTFDGVHETPPTELSLPAVMEVLGR